MPQRVHLNFSLANIMAYLRHIPTHVLWKWNYSYSLFLSNGNIKFWRRIHYKLTKAFASHKTKYSYYLVIHTNYLCANNKKNYCKLKTNSVSRSFKVPTNVYKVDCKSQSDLSDYRDVHKMFYALKTMSALRHAVSGYFFKCYLPLFTKNKLLYECWGMHWNINMNFSNI